MSWLSRLHMWPTSAGPGSSTASRVHQRSQPSPPGSMSKRTWASGRFRQIEDQITRAGSSGSTMLGTVSSSRSVWSDPERVFTTAHGTPLEPRNINHEWAKVCATAGIAPIRPHDLRHSMATFALRQGVDMKTIQSMLRHSRLATTADLYTHVLREVQRSGSDRIGDLLTEHGLGSVAATPPRA